MHGEKKVAKTILSINITIQIVWLTFEIVIWPTESVFCKIKILHRQWENWRLLHSKHLNYWFVTHRIGQQLGIGFAPFCSLAILIFHSRLAYSDSNNQFGKNSNDKTAILLHWHSDPCYEFNRSSISWRSSRNINVSCHQKKNNDDDKWHFEFILIDC